MSFNLANRLNNLAAATSTLSTNLAENYYTKAETDTEITNLKNKQLVIKNDNDANDPLLVNDSANASLFTVGQNRKCQCYRSNIGKWSYHNRINGIADQGWFLNGSLSKSSRCLVLSILIT